MEFLLVCLFSANWTAIIKKRFAVFTTKKALPSLLIGSRPLLIRLRAVPPFPSSDSVPSAEASAEAWAAWRMGRGGGGRRDCAQHTGVCSFPLTPPAPLSTRPTLPRSVHYHWREKEGLLAVYIRTKLIIRPQEVKVNWLAHNPRTNQQKWCNVPNIHRNAIRVSTYPLHCLSCVVWVICRWFVRDLSAIWAGTEKSPRALPVQIALKSRTNHPNHIRKTVKRVSEHFYCISVHIRDIASFPIHSSYVRH